MKDFGIKLPALFGLSTSSEWRVMHRRRTMKYATTRNTEFERNSVRSCRLLSVTHLVLGQARHAVPSTSRMNAASREVRKPFLASYYSSPSRLRLSARA